MNFGTASLTFCQLEDAASVAAAEVFANGCLVERRIGDEVPRVIDIGERFDVVGLLHEGQQIRYRKDAMGVEFDPLLPDGDGKIELPLLFQHPVHILPADEVAVVVHRIAVASETEMLQRVETGEGITVIGQRELLRRKVGPGEADVGEAQMEVADVQDLDLPE